MVTLQTANEALKTMYLDVVANQLNNNTHPFLSKIEKTSQDVVGKAVKKLVPYGVNGGIGAGTEAGALPKSGFNNYLLFNTTLKNLYGTIELSDKALRASSSEASAFVNLLTAEMEGMINASKFNMSRMLYGDGSGLLATGNSVMSGEYFFIAESFKNLMVGMVVDVYVNDVYTLTTRIVSWDYNNKVLTFDVPTTAEMGDVANNVTLYMQGSKGKEITGLKALFSNDTLYGNSVATYGFLKPFTLNVASGEFNETSMMEVIDTLDEQKGSEIDFIVGALDARRMYQSALIQNKLNVDIMKLDGGYKTISFNGIPFVADRFANDGEIFFLNSKDFKMHQLCDWEWISNDKGQILKQKEGYPVHSATLVKYAELMCEKPGGQGKLVIAE
ncbi:MAG: phage major capsid protein [Clostridia bacterium]|nr:phage major capsid protein [Clostridia bacterium]